MRTYLYDAIHRLVAVGQNAAGEQQTVILQPDVFEETVAGLDSWREQYEEMHGHDAFEDMDPAAFEGAAQEITIIDSQSPRGQAWGKIIDRLKEQKRGKERDNPEQTD